MSKELYNCPFCGGDNIISTYNNFIPVLLCGDCGAMMTIPMSFKGNYKKELIRKWNNRKLLERIIERLEEEFRFSDSEKHRCIKENPLQFDYAKGYAYGIYNAIEIVSEEGGMND